MITRKMNHRVTFFREIGGQMKMVRIYLSISKNYYTCWAGSRQDFLEDFQREQTKTGLTRKLKELFLRVN